MRKLTEVEEAKLLFTQAQEWSVWRWLFEKKRVRKAADAANQALDACDASVKDSWSAQVKAAYRSKNGGNPAVERARQADERAWNAHLDAEATFEEAERALSAAVAREGARKAILSWELKESAIRKSEALARKGLAG
jgi:hypothetical protein